MAKKSKARKPAAQQKEGELEGTDQPSSDMSQAVVGYFPFAGYTSVVGVHTTLLAFSALFLPRTTDVFELLAPEVETTSKDRPQHPFLDTLTRNPAATLVCICAGAVVLQSWWGGWVRGWAIDYVLHGAGLERQLDRARMDERKLTSVFHAWLTTAAASAIFHGVLVLFGAPLASHIWKTYLLSFLISVLTVFPPAYTLGCPLIMSAPDAVMTRMTWVRVFAEFSTRTPVERALLYPAVGTILGCWAGAIPIALDWDRPWQAWPLTPAFGAVAGYIVSSIAALTANAVRFFADEHLRTLREAKMKTN
ncbi:GPI biosynthesis protein family Pig-F-domain-containing protein [Mycena belliarum]|uniref:GPI biosynthesis protein family Pig-F-domain-containing protein n=1 Tax=Mycena belliarum TaxID=1033014 RepID=A0AAD6TP64_9AGAR|nr:GPI biosynthesis protein family Pig-F-domain-containing protein [Mycena belliae]